MWVLVWENNIYSLHSPSLGTCEYTQFSVYARTFIHRSSHVEYIHAAHTYIHATQHPYTQIYLSIYLSIHPYSTYMCVHGVERSIRFEGTTYYLLFPCVLYIVHTYICMLYVHKHIICECEWKISFVLPLFFPACVSLPTFTQHISMYTCIYLYIWIDRWIRISSEWARARESTHINI